MSKGRLSIDLDDFKPEPKKIGPEIKATAEHIAESSGFKTRHAGDNARKPKVGRALPDVRVEGEEVAARRRGRKRTTNRNTPFTVKLRLETNNRIYDYADQLECSAIAEVIELALGALQKELDDGIDPRARASTQIT